METVPKTKFEKHSYVRKPKRKTSHEHVPPVAALRNHRCGKVKVEYIQDKKKRSNTLSDRKYGIFKKARELWTMTGAEITLVVNGEEWDCKYPQGRPLEDHEEKRTEIPVNQVTVQTDEPETQREAAAEENNSVNEHEDDSLFNSPRNIRRRTSTTTAPTTQPLWNPCQTQQAIGTDRGCRICGGLYSIDEKKKQDLWMGCDKEDCTFWIHSKCLLGEWPKKTIIAKIPFLCPEHRK